MTTNFQITKDENDNVAYGLVFTKDNYSIALTAGSNQSLIVPTNTENWVALFQYSVGNNVYVANSSSGITPPSSSFVRGNFQLNPPLRQVKGGDTLQFLTEDTGGAAVVVSFYSLPSYT